MVYSTNPTKPILNGSRKVFLDERRGCCNFRSDLVIEGLETGARTMHALTSAVPLAALSAIIPSPFIFMKGELFDEAASSSVEDEAVTHGLVKLLKRLASGNTVASKVNLAQLSCDQS